MQFSSSLVLLLASAGLLEAAATRHHARVGTLTRRQNRNGGNNNNNNNNNNNGASQTCLAANALQTASGLTGQESGTTGIAAGQSASKTDDANFIDFCSGQTLTNGQQNTAGSCNGIPMGKIPSKANMISSIITFPQPGDKVQSDTTFNIVVQTQKLTAGTFTNPQTTYYSAPQDLDSSGNIIGHCHVTVQNIGNSLRVTTPPDPSTFAFFKGIDDAGNGNGLLQATVTGGLPAGFYRVCTLIGAANHQPVIMPVAQRGAQDDCTKFEVVDDGATANIGNAGGNNNSNNNANANNNNNNNNNANAGNNNAGNANNGNNGGRGGGRNGRNGQGAAASTVAAAAATSAAANTGGNAGNTGAGAGAAAIPTIKSGNLGGAAPAITASGDSARPFSVNGNTFVNAAAAIQRACDVQFNQCANLANSGQLNGKTLNDCNTQKSSCGAA